MKIGPRLKLHILFINIILCTTILKPYSNTDKNNLNTVEKMTCSALVTRIVKDVQINFKAKFKLGTRMLSF